jgi:hypothetical protein
MGGSGRLVVINDVARQEKLQNLTPFGRQYGFYCQGAFKDRNEITVDIVM